jgi:hypothetical protein
MNTDERNQMSKQQTIGEALRDTSTVLGRSAANHKAMLKQVAAMSPSEQQAFWTQAAAAKS